MCTHSGCLFLVEFCLSFEFFIKLTTRGVLQNEVHTSGVIEITKQSQNVWMSVERAKEHKINEDRALAIHKSKNYSLIQVQVDTDRQESMV